MDQPAALPFDVMELIVPVMLYGGFVLLGLALLGLLIAAYFLPTIIARDREHHNSAAIFVLNVVAGWLFIGWVVALVWSLTAVRAPEPPRPRIPPRLY